MCLILKIRFLSIITIFLMDGVYIKAKSVCAYKFLRLERQVSNSIRERDKNYIMNMSGVRVARQRGH
jgi:hypothetical protein